MLSVDRRRQLLLNVQVGEKEVAPINKDDPFPGGSKVVPYLMYRLSAHIQAVLKENLNQLIERNAERTGNYEGYLYQGLQYTLSPAIRATLAVVPPISPEYEEDAVALEEAIVGFDEDKYLLRQGLVLVLLGTKSWQDVRDALPDVLRSYLPPITSLPRERPEAYTLETRPIQQAQYAETRKLIDYHLSTEIFG